MRHFEFKTVCHTNRPCRLFPLFFPTEIVLVLANFVAIVYCLIYTQTTECNYEPNADNAGLKMYSIQSG